VTLVWYVRRFHRNLLPPSGLLWKIHTLSTRLHGLTSRVGSVASAVRIWNHTLFRPRCWCVYDLIFLAPVVDYLQPWIRKRHETKNSHCLCFVILDSTNKNSDSFSEVNFITWVRLVVIFDLGGIKKYGSMVASSVSLFQEITWGRNTYIQTYIHARTHTHKQAHKQSGNHLLFLSSKENMLVFA